MSTTRKLRTAVAVIAFAGLLGACGSNDSLNGTTVSGVVEAPDGEIASSHPTLWRWLVQLVVPRVLAMTGLEPVGAGVRVTLSLVGGVGEDCQPALSTLATVSTSASGTYVHPLASNENPGSSLLLSVGNEDDDTLMRAFVDGEDVNISPATEATVRLVLVGVCDNGYPLGNFTAPALRSIQVQVNEATADTPAGDSIEEANDNAEEDAASDPDVQAIIEQVGES